MRRITNIERNRFTVDTVRIPAVIHNRLRKNSKKKSSYASNKIEGNPLTEAQADTAIESDAHKHFLKPEQEIRNYFMALNLLEDKAKKSEPFSIDLILKVQALIEKGASKEKIGLRTQIPPEYSEVPKLLNELVEYVNTTDDHPLIVAGVVHYQLVTIHPFGDGNGKAARLLSGYILDSNGFGFGGIGSLEEYFAYDPKEYYSALQMDLPPLYYSGRNNPPQPKIWIDYFLRMLELYSDKVRKIAEGTTSDTLFASLANLNKGEIETLTFLLKKKLYEFTPIQVSRLTGVTNKTIIRHCVKLAANGFIKPMLVNERIRSYKLTDFAIDNERDIKKMKK